MDLPCFMTFFVIAGRVVYFPLDQPKLIPKKHQGHMKKHQGHSKTHQGDSKKHQGILEKPQGHMKKP